MPHGKVSIKLRPIKFAFLVNPRDTKALLEIIKINTFLWGGRFNPIVPVFQRTPKVWQERPRTPRVKSIITGYIDAYDPDYIVPMDKYPYLDSCIGYREIVSFDQILANIERYGVPKYGIGLFEILNHFIHEELRFVRRKPIDFSVPIFGKRYYIFLASVLGLLPESLNEIFWNRYAEPLGTKKVKCNLSNYIDFFKKGCFFFGRLSSLYVRTIGVHSWNRNTCVFYLDATKSLDIIDYWNLRALGWNVIPVPKQANQEESVKKFVRNFIEENSYPSQYNPEIYHYTIILKSRHTTEDEVGQFISSLGVPPSSHPNEPKFIFQYWYPRIWDEWARDKGNVQCCDLEADSIEHDLTKEQGRFSFKTLGPKFITHSIYGGPRFANEVIIHSYGDEIPVAEVIPEGDIRLARAIGAMELGRWRFSKKGLVYLAPYSGWTVFLNKPMAEDVFSEWLRDQGWQVKLSPAGRIARQMLKQLGGIWGINILAEEGLIKLLREMTGGKTKRHKKFWGEISKIVNQRWGNINKNKLSGLVKRMIKKLTEDRIIQVGMEIQCPICQQYSWYSVKEADYQLKCPKCLARFELPSYSPKEIKWSYRTIGPFSLPKQAYGAYSVLLTLRFFAQILNGATTPIMSFEAIKAHKKIEVDLGLLFQGMKFLSSNIEIVFAECKTFNEFKVKDIRKIKAVARKFPGAVIVFATLKDSLTKKERKLLLPFVNRSREYWQAGRPYNPVLILTGIELFSDLRPPHCWKEAGGTYADFAKKYRYFHNLLTLCDATQQLYLGLPPWHEWLRKQWESSFR